MANFSDTVKWLDPKNSTSDARFMTLSLIWNDVHGVIEPAISAHIRSIYRTLPPVCICTTDYRPVCASINGGIADYPNECFASCEYVSFSGLEKIYVF